MSNNPRLDASISEYISTSSTITNLLQSLPSNKNFKKQATIADDIQHHLLSQQHLLESIIDQLKHTDYATKQRYNTSSIAGYNQQLDQQNERYTQFQKLLASGRPVPSSAAAGTSALSSSYDYNIDMPSSSSASTSTSNSTSSSLLGSSNGTDVWKQQREALLGTRNILDDTSSSLDRTTFALAETEQIGGDTHQQLLQQREQFARQKEMLEDTNDFLSRSKRVMNRMKRRIITNKLIQYIIIALELALLLLIAYVKYWK
jgi:hypothetical protein